MDSKYMTLNQMLGILERLAIDPASVDARILLSVNGECFPLSSIRMQASMNTDEAKSPSYTFVLSGDNNNEECAYEEEYEEDTCACETDEQDVEEPIPLKPVIRRLADYPISTYPHDRMFFTGIKVGDTVAVAKGYQYAGYIGKVEGIGDEARMYPDIHSVEFDTIDGDIVMSDDCYRNRVLYVKLAGVDTPVKLTVYEVEVLPAGYNERVSVKSSRVYGILYTYYVKKGEVESAIIETMDGRHVCVRNLQDIVNESKPDVRKRIDDISGRLPFLDIYPPRRKFQRKNKKNTQFAQDFQENLEDYTRSESVFC